MAGSLFDGLQKAVFTTVENLYGSTAIWTPSGGGPAVTAQVLYNAPTAAERLIAGPASYTEVIYTIQYQAGYFPGLVELVDAQNTTEFIAIDGQSFEARHAIKEFDGKTITIRLTPAE